MMFFVRFIINFCISFVILSIPINDKTIFNHIYRLTGPLASKKMKTIKKRVGSLLPDENYRKNSNQEKVLKKFTTVHEQHKFPSLKKKDIGGESYTDEEREVMRRVLQQYP